MPTEIEDQIASYFTWVEARSGFVLHAPEVSPASRSERLTSPPTAARLTKHL